MTTFIDGIVLTQKHRFGTVRDLAGIRSIAYRGAGDVNRLGEDVNEEEVIGEQFRHAWIQGSHSTAIRVKSEDGLVSLCGNPGRWSRPDNLFNADLEGTIDAASHIARLKGLPDFDFGEPIASARLDKVLLPNGFAYATGGIDMKPEAYVVSNGDGTFRQGARVWSIHATRNYLTGSEANAQAVLNWLDSQSVARVKKKRFGKSTVTWGNLNYCQTEAYIKHEEMFDHCQGNLEREMMRQNPAYQWAKANGVVRIEVKAAKDYLRDRDLTWLGAWDMSKVIQLFEERTEILHRVKCDIEEFDPSTLPSVVATTAAAWLRGEDVRPLLKKTTFFKYAKILREYGIDISEKRNIEQMPIKIKTIELRAAAAPDWYSMERTPLVQVAA
ncbi:MAG: phage/plasmid replication protein [Propionivibrio sp.]